MRIAFICMDKGVPVFDWRKGCSIHAQEMMRAFSELGHEVTLFAASLRGKPPHDLAHIRVRQIKIATHDQLRAEREQRSWQANIRLRAELCAMGPFDLVYERYSLWSYAGMQYAADRNLPGVLEVNAPLIEEQSQHRGLINRRLAEDAVESCVANASLVVAVSDEVGSYVKRFAGANVEVMANGVNPMRFQRCGRSPAAQHRRFTVGFVGSLKVWHGVDRLVDAYTEIQKKTPDSQLLIVGDGPERASIENQVERLGLTRNVSMVGAVSPDRIPEFLNQMDVGVAPYPALDAFYFSPMKVYEYMAAGLAVVVSDIGQLSDLVVDEVNGLVCPADNWSALHDAILCLHRDPALRQRLGRRGRATVLRQHTWCSNARRVVALASTRQRFIEHPDPVLQNDAL